MPRFKLLLLRSSCSALFLVLFGCNKSAYELTIYSSSDTPRAAFALKEIESALREKNMAFEYSDRKDADIVLDVQQIVPLKPQGFSIKRQDGHLKITGFDLAGAMYGGLEVAEQIRLYGLDSIKETEQNPYMEMRGPKFNIPLDMRTPSYTDASDTGQKNIPVMWDFGFWKKFIDDLARDRYNYISLWSLHPFPSLVKVPGYEDIALNNVQRSTVKWKENYNLNGIGLDAPEILDNPETVKKVSIDEKIKFWQKVMQYGKDRNVDFHIITWNIFTNGTEGKYGITDKRDNEVTKHYFRKSVKQLFVTYPNLAGIGLTTGENMKGAGPEEREDWAFDTYAQGILDAAKEMPDRQFTFIHRQHQSGAKEIAKKFKPVIDAPNVEFLYCFKYAKAHVYSATTQPYHEKDDFVEDIKGMKTLWGLRNDDTYYYRWGAPDFVREFIKNIPHEVAKGIYFGSDQWIWGREFLTKDPETPNQLEIEKHWYQWLMWGRLAYNPDLSDERFTQILKSRYPDVNAHKLFDAWQNASMVYPTTTGFHWGRLDFQWYIEGCKSQPRPAENSTGFHDVNRFISLPPHPKSGFQSITDFVKMKAADSTSALKSPFEVAEKLHQYSDKALEILKILDAAHSKELKFTLNDIKTVAYLGKYYAYKIEGATNLALYRDTNNKTYQTAAVVQLTKALEFWKKYTEASLSQNKNPLWTNRVGYVDFNQITDWVSRDIEIAKE